MLNPEASGAMEPVPRARFGLYLCTLLTLSTLMYLGSAWYAKNNWADIAPQFSSNLVFNQKILFLRNIWSDKTPATLIVGSSIALNDFDSDELSDATGERVINLGATGQSISTSEQLFREVASGIPTRDVIFVVQFNEMRGNIDRDGFVFPSGTFAQYVSGNMNWIEEFAYRDFSTLFNVAKWRSNFLNSRDDYSSADFNRTGAVPLEIYGSAISASRWNGENFFPQRDQCTDCYRPLKELCMAGKDFTAQPTLVIPPISPHLAVVRPDLKIRYDNERAIMTKVMTDCGAKTFDVGSFSTFDNSCFVDTLHMNAEGSKALAGLYVQWSKGASLAGDSKLSCSPPNKGAALDPTDAPRDHSSSTGQT